MILYPAIDLKNGHCVRLLKGDYDNPIVYNNTPVAQAKIFQEAGCNWVHLVDLDGAIAGSSKNGKIAKNIVRHTALKIQLGGGIRDMKTITHFIQYGVSRIILGTMALKCPDMVKEAARRFPGKIAIAIDARNGRIAYDGWMKQSSCKAITFAKFYEDSEICAIIYTDIDRDGMMNGINQERTIELANAVSIPIIASGGIANYDDLHKLKDTKLNGVICGRSIYENTIDVKQAIECLKGDNNA